MVHLAPLPGSPRYGGDLSAVKAAARADTEALVAGGVGAVLVENFHDMPFWPDAVPPVTVAAMAVITADLRRHHPDLSLGVNVLRNDARAALSIAAAAGADFIRVNVHCGAAVTDQGLIQGQAQRTMRLRRELDLDARHGRQVAILTDLRVKHARPLAERPLVDEARDLRRRGLADALILSGEATGAPADPQQLAAVRAALPDCPLLIGSGMSPANVAVFAEHADAYIVGSALQRPVDEGRPVAEELTAEFVAAVSAAHSSGKDEG